MLYYLLVTSIVTLVLLVIVLLGGKIADKNTEIVAGPRQDKKITNWIRLKLKGKTKVIIGLAVRVNKNKEEGGLTFFEALRWLDEFNKKFGTSARLIGHRTAEILLASGKHNGTLEAYSPFWTGTIIAYETRRAEKLGETISSYHHPKDDRPLYTAQFPTGQFCGGTKCALTVEGLTERHFVFDDVKREITINNEGQSVAKTDGFPDHPAQLFQDDLSAVPSLNATGGRKLWLIRADRPVLFGGGWEGEAVNPFFDNYVGPIVRSAPLPGSAQADEAFVANADFFDQCGVLLEVDQDDISKIK